MASLNRVTLIGNVGRDAELRHTASGQAVANFTVATSETFGGRDGVERQQRTEWHNVQAWSRNAELAAQYVKKGKQVYIEGRLQTRDWVDPQGVKHYKTEIVAQRFLLLGNRNTDESPADDSYDIGDLGPPLD